VGFFKGKKDAVKQYAESLSKPKKSEVVQITFGAGYIDACNQILDAVKQGKWSGGNQMTISFDDSLLAEIDGAVSGHYATGRVLYSDDMQFLDVVGESFHQEELRELYNQVQDGWLSGFLMPEPLNPHDPNAISVMIICDAPEGEEGLRVIQSGHLKKEQAKKVAKKIINFVEQDAYIPVLLKLSGGSLDKPNLGVIARAKTDKVKF